LPNTVLVSLVGMNPASALVSARVLQPARVVLIHTTQTQEKAQALERQIAPTPVRRVCWPHPCGVDEVAARVADDVALQTGEAVTLDLTGATTLFSVGAWAGLSAALGTGFQAVYLRQNDSRLCDARTAEVLSLGTADISPKEVLAWYGAAPLSQSWSGRLDQVPKRVFARLPLYRAVCTLWAQPGGIVRVKGRPAWRLNGKRLPQPLPAGFRLHQGALWCDADTDCIGANRWLEEYCLAVAAEELGRTATVHGALGLATYVGSNKGVVDEGDVVLVLGGRVVVLEAKANLDPKGAGADVQKRVQKVRRFYGSHAQVIVVRPVWGDAPPQALAELMAEHAQMVGNNERSLRHAVRRALGFPPAGEAAAFQS